TLNRAELARQAFAAPDATEKLNSITHPRIRERTLNRFAQARTDGVPVLVYDMPLLIENGEYKKMDHVLVVDAADEIRIDRLVNSRGLDEEDARRRIAAQISREERDRKSTRLNSSHVSISYAVFCLKKKKKLEHK